VHRAALPALLLLLWLLSATGASAHAALTGSQPQDGAVVASAPAEAGLTFSEPVQPVLLRLATPAGDTTELSAVAHGSTLTVALPRELARGTYALSWRVISADGHPVGGAVVFAVGVATPPPGLAETADRAQQVLIWLTGTALLLGLFVGTGGSLYAVSIAGPLPRWARTAISSAIALGLVAAPLSIGLQGLDLLLQPLPRLARAEPWTAGWATAFGATAALAAVSLIGAGLALHLRQRSLRNPLAGIGALALLASFAASGHVGTAEPRLVSLTALLVHVAAVAFWAGALVPLLALLRTGQGEAFLRRFSRAIPLPLAALVVSGLALAAIQLRSFEALWRTDYGLVLCLKLAVVTGLFALAAVNRFAFTSAVLTGARGASRRLPRAIAIELVLVICTFAVVGLWRFTPPPRAPAAAGPAAFTHIHTTQAAADVTILRTAPDRARIAVVLQTGEFQPLDAREVTVVLANPDAGIEPIRRVASLAGEVWRVDGVMLPAAGRWTVAIEVLVSDFERIGLQGELLLKRD
jgi:copper transport protein